MCTVEIIRNSEPQIGYYSRTKTSGPELARVEAFIHQRVGQLSKSSLKSNALIMVEPLIDSGYPDIVIMLYSDAFMDYWKPERNRLDATDLKVLSYINAVGSTDSVQVSLALGFEIKRVEKTVDLLRFCQMVAMSGKTIKRTSKAHYFGLRKVMAFEAKQSDVRGAILQAAKNVRFSNESYVLLGSKRPAKSTLDSCRNANVGLICGDSFTNKIRPQHRSLPNSYVTLKFNEWLGMRLAQRTA